jgi:hypothetical protein
LLRLWQPATLPRQPYSELVTRPYFKLKRAEAVPTATPRPNPKSVIPRRSLPSLWQERDKHNGAQ